MTKTRTTPRMTKQMNEKIPFKLWACLKCDRQNLMKYTHCPRCGTLRPDTV